LLLNLHEYQAKALFAEYGIPIPSGRVAASPAEAHEAAESLGGNLWVVKAQVHAGGRGKAGGVKLARSAAEVESAAREMLGRKLVTRQTGKEGLPVDKVYVERGSTIARELYLSMLVDRTAERVAIIASAAGGMDIEEVAKDTPEKILNQKLHPVAGIQDFQTRELGFGLGLVKEQQAALRDILRNLVKLMHECDASLVEVNPLIVTTEGAVVALDAKINIEDNALFRQAKLAAMRDVAQEDALERRAREHDLSYVSLDGSIACLVNGAGLAMATMDLIKLHGGEPANFLDVGGGATAERVEEAFNIILANRNVRAILVNIFGGIVRCDLIAEGVIAAIKNADVRVPIVVRLEGTNVDKGMELLRRSGLAIVAATGLTDAASKAVELARRRK
jgi:succinyl-CoA synthetase beta subunit